MGFESQAAQDHQPQNSGGVPGATNSMDDVYRGIKDKLTDIEEQ